MRLTVTIKRRTPSQNAATFGHWRGYTKERDAWYVLLRAALKPRPAPRHLISAEITSFRNRLLDYGNLVGGMKPIPDCLVRLGYLKDDGPAWFDCEYRQEKCRRADERTVITILNL